MFSEEKVKKWSAKDCGCSECKTQKKKNLLRNTPRKFSMPKRKIFFKKRPQHSKAKPTSCFICKKPGHWASQCPLRSKTKSQIKIMDLFLTGYDPAEWDEVSHRSDGEYLSISEDSDSSTDHDLPDLDHSDSDSE
jgi:hypothetical protein